MIINSIYSISGHGSAIAGLISLHHDQTDHHSLPPSIEGKTVRTPTGRECTGCLGMRWEVHQYTPIIECLASLPEGDLPGLTAPAFKLLWSKIQVLYHIRCIQQSRVKGTRDSNLSPRHEA